MDSEVFALVIKTLKDLIFEIEQIRDRNQKQTNYTIEVRDKDGKIVDKLLL